MQLTQSANWSCWVKIDGPYFNFYKSDSKHGFEILVVPSSSNNFDQLTAPGRLRLDRVTLGVYCLSKYHKC